MIPNHTRYSLKKIILPLLFLASTATHAWSQDFFVKANFVSAYLWRGLDVGGPCIQPSIGVSWKGLTFTGWASTEITKKCNEIDLTLSYQYKGFYTQLNDVFVQEGDARFNYFDYNNQSTNHTLELGIGYTLQQEKLPFTFMWYTTVAGKDRKIDGKRTWSTYFELSYPFQVKGIGVKLEAGCTPWKGSYADEFNVVNVSMEVSKAIAITDRFALPVAGKLMFNPHGKQTMFALKLSI